LVKKNNRFKDALPKSSLTPKPKHPAASVPKLTYCVSPGLTPPANVENPMIITARLLSKVLASLQFVVPNSQINPIDDDESPQNDPKTLFNMSDDEVSKYLWTHKTKSDTFRCSFKLSTDQELKSFKQDPTFLTWLKTEKIQLDKTYLLGQDSTRIGFMIGTETNGEFVDLLEKRVRNRFSTAWKWQFDLHTAWIKSKDDVSVKVTMFRAPKILETEITKEFHNLFNYGRTITFYPWNDFIDLSDEQKHKIVKEQLSYQSDFRTVSFFGFQDFDTRLTIMEAPTQITETQKRKFVIEEQDTSIQVGNNIIHAAHPLGNMTVIEGIQSQFLSSKGEKLFHRVNRPVGGVMECLVKKHLFFQAKKLSNQTFLNSLSTLIPSNRHPMIFKSPSDLGSTSPIPSKLLFNRINDMLKHQKSSVDDTPIKTPPRQRQRRANKLVVYSDYKEAAASMPESPRNETKTSKDTPTPSEKTPVTTDNSNEMMDKLSKLFTSFSQKIDLRLSTLENKQENDHNSLTNVQTEVGSLRTSINTTNEAINSMEKQIVQSIDVSVKGHLQQYAASFEVQLSKQITSNSEFLLAKTEERAEKFRLEQQAFMMEMRQASNTQEKNFNAMKNLLEQHHPDIFETEIVFNPEQHSHQTIAETQDLSFESNHE
jgi:hypothetical protein